MLTVNELIKLWKPLTAAEQEKAETLIPIAYSILRLKAARVGKNLDEMIEESTDFEAAVKMTVASAISRNLTTGDHEAASQITESAGGYSATFSPVNMGNQLSFLNNELKALGLKRQRLGVINFD